MRNWDAIKLLKLMKTAETDIFDRCEGRNSSTNVKSFFFVWLMIWFGRLVLQVFVHQFAVRISSNVFRGAQHYNMYTNFRVEYLQIVFFSLQNIAVYKVEWESIWLWFVSILKSLQFYICQSFPHKTNNRNRNNNTNINKKNLSIRDYIYQVICQFQIMAIIMQNCHLWIHFTFVCVTKTKEICIFRVNGTFYLVELYAIYIVT